MFPRYVCVPQMCMCVFVFPRGVCVFPRCVCVCVCTSWEHVCIGLQTCSQMCSTNKGYILCGPCLGQKLVINLVKTDDA